MELWQQRVIEEKHQLDDRARALSVFIGLAREFDKLHPLEQARLRAQNEVMWQYSEILGERIRAFSNVDRPWPVPVAYRRVSNITGEVTGYFPTDADVELKSEHLEPLYSQP